MKKEPHELLFWCRPPKEEVEEASPEETAAFDEIDQLLEEYDAKPKTLDKAGAQPEKKKDVAPKDGFYIMRPGDSPWKVAKKFHISFERLLELNNLDETKARNLKVGQPLRIKES